MTMFPGILFNVLLILVYGHVLGSSLKWVIVHRRNGWAYAGLPALAACYGLFFQALSVVNKFESIGIDPVFLNYMSQVSAVVIGISYAVGLRLHLRYLRACGAV